MTMRFASAGSSAYASPLAATAGAALDPAYEDRRARRPTPGSKPRAAPDPLGFRLAVGLSALGLLIAALFPLAAPYVGSGAAQICGAVLGFSLLVVLSRVFDRWHHQKTLAAASAGAWGPEVGSDTPWVRTLPQGGRRRIVHQRGRGRAIRA
jgi:hypothetical protein